MNNPALKNHLLNSGFLRIETDDRLHDILPGQSREKGVELWEKWSGDKILIVRIHVDKPREKPLRYSLPKNDVIASLESYRSLSLSDYSS